MAEPLTGTLISPATPVPVMAVTLTSPVVPMGTLKVAL